MKTPTTLLLAALIGAALSAQAAAPWRMYSCTGESGETVYSDRHSGTDCVEIWLDPRGKSGWLVTDSTVKTVKTAEKPE
jgi:hypothetical protein